MKADIRKRRNDREKIEKSRQTETNRRCERIESIFDQLHVASNGRIEISIVNLNYSILCCIYKHKICFRSASRSISTMSTFLKCLPKQGNLLKWVKPPCLPTVSYATIWTWQSEYWKMSLSKYLLNLKNKILNLPHQTYLFMTSIFKCMIALSEHLSSEFFDMLLEFFKECATYFVQLANKTRLNKILIRLFGLVDSTNVNKSYI